MNQARVYHTYVIPKCDNPRGLTGGDHEVIATSVQGFETTLSLIASNRFPHALTMAFSSLEAILQRKFKVSQRVGKSSILLNEMNDELRMFSKKQLETYRKTRNYIVHSGYSPKDDKISLELLVSIAIPALINSYKSFYNVVLSPIAGEETTNLLELVSDIDRELKARDLSDPYFCLHPLSCHIRDLHRQWFSSEWQLEAVLNSDERLNFVSKIRSKIDKDFGFAVALDCPVCGEINSLVCALDEDEFDDEIIIPVGAVCSACYLKIPAKYNFVASILLSHEIDAKREDILNPSSICWV